jgi:hypothetical protein
MTVRRQAASTGRNSGGGKRVVDGLDPAAEDLPVRAGVLVPGGIASGWSAARRGGAGPRSPDPAYVLRRCTSIRRSRRSRLPNTVDTERRSGYKSPRFRPYSRFPVVDRYGPSRVTARIHDPPSRIGHRDFDSRGSIFREHRESGTTGSVSRGRLSCSTGALAVVGGFAYHSMWVRILSSAQPGLASQILLLLRHVGVGG